MRLRTAVLTLAFAYVAAPLSPAGAQELKRDKDRITRAEIEATPQKDADIYQVIRNLRPHMLRPARGIRSFNAMAAPPAVYVDGRKETDLDILKTIPAAAIDEVRYLDPSKAESEYGQDAQSGAVVLKRTKVGLSSPAAPAPPKDTTKPPQR